MKSHEPIAIGPIRGLAEYVPGHAGTKAIWLLRLTVGEHAIEGWGATQDEAKFMFLETGKQWLKDTNQHLAIR